jgi:hypothetical protein
VFVFFSHLILFFCPSKKNDATKPNRIKTKFNSKVIIKKKHACGNFFGNDIDFFFSFSPSLAIPCRAFVEPYGKKKCSVQCSLLLLSGHLYNGRRLHVFSQINEGSDGTSNHENKDNGGPKQKLEIAGDIFDLA